MKHEPVANMLGGYKMCTSKFRGHLFYKFYREIKECVKR